MDKHLSFLALALQLCACTLSPQDIPTYDDSSFRISERLSNNYIQTFGEDGDGHIWIGTSYGLNKYDGDNYHIYFNSDSPSTINNNNSKDILLDREGRLWIVTISGVCLYNPDTDDFSRITMDDDFPASNRICQLEEGEIIVLKNKGTVLRYDPDSNSFKRALDGIPAISNIFPSHDGLLWAIAQDGIYLIDIYTGETKSRQLAESGLKKAVDQSAMDPSGNVWFIDNGSVKMLDGATGELSDFQPSSDDFENSQADALYSAGKYIIIKKNGFCWFYDTLERELVPQSDGGFRYQLPDFVPACFFMDSRENLWVGSLDKGFAICSPHKPLFNRNRKLCNRVSGRDVLAVASLGNLLISVTGDNELVCSDIADMEDIRAYDAGMLQGSGTGSKNLVILGDGRLILSLGNYLHLLSLEPSGQLKTLGSYELDGNINKLLSDDAGHLYVGTYNGRVLRYGLTGNALVKDNEISLGVDDRLIYDICILEDGGICISQFREELCIWYPDQKRIIPLNYREQLGELFHLVDIEPGDNGDLWIGTRDYGLLHYTAADGRFSKVDGISSRRISSIKKANDGKVWVATYYGLNVISPGSDTPVQYLYDSGIGNSQFHGRVACALADGTVAFGGNDGLTLCHLQDSVERGRYPIVFENLEIQGKDVHPSAKGAFKKSLSSSPVITLRHDQRDFSIAFAALKYEQAETVAYRYRMSGEWAPLGRVNSISFSNLPAGHHRLDVGFDSISGESSGENSILIKVLPHPLASPLAYSLYFLIFLAAGALVLRNARKQWRMRTAISQLNIEKEHEKYVNRMNMNFFANMAHEFRAPLTLVEGPLKQLEESQELSQNDRDIVSVMKISVARLMRLVNQLMDFNSLDNNSLKLKVFRKCNVTAVIARCVESIGVNASREDISVSTSGLDVPYLMPADPDKIESVMGNLLSNALKYSSRATGKGRIDVGFEERSDGFVEIHVDNDGEPLASKDLERIFDRYYQLRRHTEDTRLPGTGIGLYFARMLAERMHGSLSAENLPDGIIRFTLRLPVSASSFSEDEFVEKSLPTAPQDERTIQMEDTPDSGKKTVLVVDDDSDIANYLKMLLSPYYNVLCAYNGESALDMTKSKDLPDLVLSDIVMPGMDGTRLCQKIKSNILTSHIPVILETAKVGLDNEIEGLKSGADAYVSKPFDPSYLLTLVQSILKNRDAVRGELVTNTDLESVDKRYLSGQDADFMRKLYAIMEKEVANSELDIDKVVDSMAISRTKLFYKIKSLTGMTPMLLFRSYRLNVAAKLLKSGDYNVSEVYEKVGFNSLSYFTRAFKAQFGVLPKDSLKA